MVSARFFERPTNRLVRDSRDMAKLDEFVRQEAQRPATPTCRWVPTGQGDETGLLLPVEHSRTTRYRARNEGALKATFNE